MNRAKDFGRAMDDLINGYRRFRASTWQAERSRFEALSRLGQRPRALIIACSDSRTDPQMVFNARPGELFVIRNVANIVPPYGPDDKPHGVSSAIEFAVRSLTVREIVVLGHAMCGGVRALLDGAPAEASDFVGYWVRIAEPARQRALQAPADQQQHVCEHETIRLSLDNLLTFPWVKDAVEAGHLTLHGCYFGIQSGILERLDDDGIFRPIPD
ncbi:MAG: carbonic anhydrase [Xanthobacteraceae bacterium]